MAEFDLTPNDPTTPDAEPLTTAALAGVRSPTAADAPEARSFSPGDPDFQDPSKDQSRGEDAKSTPLFSTDETSALRAKWDAIQASFVDNPRTAVEQADGAVAQAMKRLAEMFADERASLEGQWDRGDDVSTEDLRQALRRYRSFFDRLLSV